MLVSMLIFVEIFLRFFVEGLLTAKRTEIIRLPVVLGCTSGGGWVNVHVANRVMHGS